jgi:hypothetical protein
LRVFGKNDHAEQAAFFWVHRRFLELRHNTAIWLRERATQEPI